jgi:2-octaprenyl-6-methoxyphenol hydroxylase
VLSAIGVWPDLANKAQPILGIRVSQGQAGQGAFPFSLGFDHAEIEEGPMGQMVEDRHLYAAFRAAMAREDRISLIDGERVVAQDAGRDRATVTLASGEELAAQLVVGCDGRDSPTAARAGIRRQGWDYGQTALVCAVAHEKPHQGVAHQFFMPAGPLAILPLPGNRSSIVWVESTADRALHRRRWTTPPSSTSCARASATSWARSRWKARAFPIRCASASPKASSPRAWRWSATPRMASTRSPGRG